MATRSAADPRRVRRLYDRLFQHFGPQQWWPGDKPWETIVGAILTQNTAWTNVKLALAQLKAANALSVNKIARIPRRRLEALIRSSGFFRQKARHLQAFARALRAQPTIWKMLNGGGKGPHALHELRAWLLAQKGIGPETADCILLYAGLQPIFVVDAYTRRIGQRVGLFRFDGYHAIQDYFHSTVPADTAMYNEFHALLDTLGKYFCKRTRPLCSACPIVSDCRWGKQHERNRRSGHRAAGGSRPPGRTPGG